MSELPDKTIIDGGPASEETNVTIAPTVLASRYELQVLLGSGGMGTVYRARDRELDELVALKVLKREIADAAGMLERFRREVKLARKVTHVNVARTFDIGEDRGDRFITMELVEGEPLSLLLRSGRLPIEHVLEIARQVLDGLAASHDAGVVHGDLKPENVISTKSGRIVITDFGIARALVANPDSEPTSSSLLVGTPQYMAPEQVEGSKDLDGRADIYALGCMLFRLLTGEPAWSGSSYVTIAAARLLQDPPDPRVHLPELPSDVRAFVTKCMAKDRADRFGDARTANVALARAMDRVSAAPAPTAVQSRVPWTPPTSREPQVATRSVAVLPIVNHGAADDAYLAAGLTDDLIDILSSVAQVRVRPRGAVAPFAGGDRDPRDVGRTLGVDAVVEGSLRRVGDVLRVTLRLVTVADGFQLWAKRFDRPASDFLAVGDAAAAQVAEVLASEKLSAARESPTDAGALDLYLRGRFIFTRSYFDVAEAVALLRAAHERAPKDGRIAASYALALIRHTHIAFLPASTTDQARVIGQRVIEEDPTVAEAHVAVALAHLFQSERRAGAVALARALEVAPRNLDALMWMGTVLIDCGRIDAGMEMLRTCVAQEPGFHLAHSNLARAHAMRGNWDECEAELDRLAGGGDETFHWMWRIRMANWRGDPERIEWTLAGLDAATLPLQLKSRLRALLVATRDGRLDDESWAVLNLEFSHAGAPRRTAFNAQIRIESLGRAGAVEAALREYPILDQSEFYDISWVDHCPTLASLRDSPVHAALRKTVKARADRILEALDSSASGLRQRAG